MAELLTVLKRPKFAKYIDINDINGLSIRITATWVSIPISNQISLCRDSKDDMFIELALNGEATYLISGDKDLLVLDPIQNIPVVSPRVFWDEIK